MINRVAARQRSLLRLIAKGTRSSSFAAQITLNFYVFTSRACDSMNFDEYSGDCPFAMEELGTIRTSTSYLLLSSYGKHKTTEAVYCHQCIKSVECIHRASDKAQVSYCVKCAYRSKALSRLSRSLSTELDCSIVNGKTHSLVFKMHL